MQVVFEAVIRKPLFEVGCCAKRNIRVLDLSHGYFLFVVHLSLYLYRAAFGCRVDAVRAGPKLQELAL
jgi:hypothetical protein